jgi:hypothetical protein
MNNFKLNRKVLSSYYVAVLISFFLFQLISPFFADGVVNIAGLLGDWFNGDFRNNGRLWLVLLGSAIVLAVIIRQFIVEPLGLFIDNEESGWEAFVLTILILGFYIYILNQNFTYSMPQDWWMPTWLIRLLGGYRNTFTPFISQAEYVEPWFLIKWLWYLGPIGFLYVRTKIAIKE